MIGYFGVLRAYSAMLGEDPMRPYHFSYIIKWGRDVCEIDITYSPKNRKLTKGRMLCSAGLNCISDTASLQVLAQCTDAVLELHEKANHNLGLLKIKN